MLTFWLFSVLASVLASLLVTVLVQFCATVARNYKAHQFFKIRSPNLPVVPNASLLGGHMKEIAFDKRNWRKVDELHKKYGKTFGVFYESQPMVSTVDLDFIKTFIIDEPNDHNDRIVPGGPIDEFERDTISLANGKQWLRLRKAIAPAFTLHKVKSANIEAEIRSVISKFIESIERRLDKANERLGEQFVQLNVDDLFHRYTLSLVMNSFYKQGNLIDFDADKEPNVQTIDEGFRNMTTAFEWCILFPILRPILQFFVINFHPFGRMRNKIISFIDEQTRVNLEARKQLATIREENSSPILIDKLDSLVLKNKEKFSRNLLDFVTDRYHEGQLSRTEYINSSYFLFLATNKSSAVTVAKLLYHLALHCEIQEKLRESIMLEGTESEYLGWVMNESMRLLPSVLSGCSRLLSRDITTQSGLLVPKGTFVYTATWTIHHSPEIWGPDVEEFKPERWKESKRFHPCQFLPFGAGKRACPGKEFATVEIKMLIDSLLRRYVIRLPPKTTDQLQFSAPVFIVALSDKPTYIQFARLQSH